MDTLEYQFHKNINNDNKIEALIKEVGFDNIIKSKNKGIISNTLYHYIKQSNEPLIQFIFNNCELMKRDYLRLANFYYKDNFELAESIFTNYIEIDNLLSKDIDYLIENNLIKLIIKLENLFINCTFSNNWEIVEEDFANSNLKLINTLDTQKIKEKLKINPVKTLFFQYPNKYKTIIDGGSVIHNRKGQITKDSLNDLLYIVNKSEEPIVIIHTKHKKTFKNLEETFKSNNINYYLTPYKYNDDIYILWFFLNNKSETPFIVSNDNYKDHIFSLNINPNILKQQTLNFNCSNKWIQNKPKYSRCIQIVNNELYIPYNENNFIKIDL